MVKVIGYKQYKSKTTGNLSTILSCIGEYEDYEKGKGQKAFEQYIKGTVGEDLLGKQVKFEYGVGFGGKAEVIGIEVIK